MAVRISSPGVLELVDEPVAAPGLPPVVDGYFALPEAPGLGVTLDVDFVAERPSTGAHFDLFQHDWHFRGTK